MVWGGSIKDYIIYPQTLFLHTICPFQKPTKLPLIRTFGINVLVILPSFLKYLADLVPEISYVPNKSCDVCPLAKKKRLPFGLSSISTREPFELIDCDIWGTFRVPSISGASYVLTIVDDFSRHTWVYILHIKSDTHRVS